MPNMVSMANECHECNNRHDGREILPAGPIRKIVWETRELSCRTN